jgi:uncharacterized low-complexity protein
MSRLFAVLACTMALSLAAPISFDAPAAAQAKKAAKSALKQCRAKAPSGKVVSWKCKSDQPCCMNTSTGQGVCGSAMIGCL